METLFESSGIVACVMDDGLIHVITEYGEEAWQDTEKNRNNVAFEVMQYREPEFNRMLNRDEIDIIFEAAGIVVGIIGGMIHTITDATDDVAEDTPENRAQAVESAKWCVEQWKH